MPHASAQLLSRIEYFRLRAHRRSRAHFLAAKRASNAHLWLGVPTMVLTVLVGSSIFISFMGELSILGRFVLGFLSLTAGILSTLQTFFKFSENSEKHSSSAAQYSALYRKLDLLKLSAETCNGSQSDYIEKFDELLTDWNDVEAASLDVADELYDKAVAEQNNDSDGV